MKDSDIEEANRKLLTKGDDSIIECPEHQTKVRFGDLTLIGQLTVLNGWDFGDDECVLVQCRNQKEEN